MEVVEREGRECPGAVFWEVEKKRRRRRRLWIPCTHATERKKEEEGKGANWVKAVLRRGRKGKAAFTSTSKTNTACPLRPSGGANREVELLHFAGGRKTVSWFSGTPRSLPPAST